MAEVVKFEDVELPIEKRIFMGIAQSRTATPEMLEKLRAFLMSTIEKFIDAEGAYKGIEFKADPEYNFELLSFLHNYCGALQGLTDSLHRRIKSRAYLDLLEKPEDGKKLTHDAKEYYAREASSDLEGVVRMLDVKQRNILENMNVQQGKLRRR